MTIYRVEHVQEKNGLWYTEDGILNPFVNKLTDQRLAQMPMGFDENMILGGVPWISAGNSLEQMKFWFSESDVKELYQAGFKMFAIEAELIRSVENHVVFARNSLISKVDCTHLLTSLYEEVA